MKLAREFSLRQSLTNWMQAECLPLNSRFRDRSAMGIAYGFRFATWGFWEEVLDEERVVAGAGVVEFDGRGATFNSGRSMFVKCVGGDDLEATCPA